ncbi:transcription antitermination factor NusB [bacterium]|nr:transcription antitermination factor NusB [bacterium]
MGKRREARRAALMAVYALDMNREQPEELLKRSIDEHVSLEQDAETFSKKLVKECLEHIELVDSLMRELSEKWEFNRIARVDRSILRLGITEILYLDDIPPKVTINEMIELSREFSSEDSWKFINGILDAVLQRTKKDEDCADIRHPWEHRGV